MRLLKALALVLAAVGLAFLAYYAVPLLFLLWRLVFSRCSPCL